MILAVVTGLLVCTVWIGWSSGDSPLSTELAKRKE